MFTKLSSFLNNFCENIFFSDSNSEEVVGSQILTESQKSLASKVPRPRPVNYHIELRKFTILARISCLKSLLVYSFKLKNIKILHLFFKLLHEFFSQSFRILQRISTAKFVLPSSLRDWDGWFLPREKIGM